MRVLTASPRVTPSCRMEDGSATQGYLELHGQMPFRVLVQFAWRNSVGSKARGAVGRGDGWFYDTRMDRHRCGWLDLGLFKYQWLVRARNFSASGMPRMDIRL